MNAGRIILGTVQFGLDYGINNSHGKTPEQVAFRILDYAFANGITILDTADAYGSSYDVVGNYHEQSEHRFTINTKFSLDKENSVSSQLQDALKRLRTNFAASYFFHRFDEMAKYPAAIDELEELKKAGLVNKTGVSIYSNEEFEVAIGSDGIDVIQLPFNLLDNWKQRGPLLKEAKRQGKEIQVRSVFLQGLFFKDPGSFPAVLKPLQPYVSAIRSKAGQWELSLEELALNYVMSIPEIDYVVLGVDTLTQLQRNLSTADRQLPGELVDWVNDIDVKETTLLYPRHWS